MEITIKRIYEQNNQLRVEVETPYGVDNLGLGLDKKYLDPETDKPKWMGEVKSLIETKYGSLEQRQKKDLEEAKDIVDTPINLNDL